jgi:tRNA A-37 threonylcarbamoyl transferase component Bud32
MTPETHDDDGPAESSVREATAPPTAAAEAGRSFGDYELLEEIGRGGVGVVYKARQKSLDRLVALKVIRSAKLASRQDVLRFRREAQAASALDHPHIVPIYEVGEADGQPYIAMKLIEGEGLDRRIAARRLAAPAKPGRAREALRDGARLLVPVARAVHDAHQHGILHRDLKPSNILIDEAGRPHVTDFGSAKRLAGPGAPGEASLTQTGALLGTPEYMAPEQASAPKSVTTAADIYGLGAILYELLTGRPPAQGETPLDALRQAQKGDPPRPRSLNPAIDRDLEAVCLKCLERDPRRRYASAEALADDLERWLARRPIRARRHGLWERGVQWARRRPRTAAALAVAGLLLVGALAAGLWYWDSQRLKVDYFAHCVLRRGAVEGAYPVLEGQVPHRSHTFKVYHRGGRVEKVEVVDGHGRLLPWAALGGLLDGDAGSPHGGGDREDDAAGDAPRGLAAEESRLEFRRDDQGRVTEVVAANAAGEIVWVFHFSSPIQGHFTDERGVFCTRPCSGVAAVEFTWNDAGFPEERRYRDRFGKPRPDRTGGYGWRDEFNDKGQAVRAANLGADGRPAPHKQGYAQTTVEHNGRGDAAAVSWLDVDGRPALTRGGYAGVRYAYDEYGNPTAIHYVGRDGQPRLTRRGYAAVQQRCDAFGDVAEITHLDLDGRPVTTHTGAAGATVRRLDEGRTLELTNLDPDGAPAPDKSGCTRVRCRLDERGDLTEITCLDGDGNPILNKEGYAKTTLARDGRGNVVEEAFLGVDGRPAWHKQGYVRVRRSFDERDNLTCETYLGSDGNPVANKDGCARVGFSYDERGDVTRIDYSDEQGRPAPNARGVVSVLPRYDARGNLTEESYRGADDKPARHKGGYARLVRSYDDDDNLRQEEYFGVDGPATPHEDGYARTTFRHDARGNVNEIAYVGFDGGPVASRAGVHRTEFTFDERYNMVEVRHFGPDGRPAPGKEGCARVRMRYDKRDNVVEERYLDPDGGAAADAEGAIGRTFRYNERDEPVAVSSFGLGDRPLDLPAGYSQLAMRYDNRDKPVEMVFLDTQGRPVRHKTYGYARAVFSYDSRSLHADSRYFDESDRPVPTRVVAVEVTPGGAADSAGLQAKDVLEAVDGHEVVNVARLFVEQVATWPDERPRPLRVLRAGRPVTLQVAPGAFLGGVVFEDVARTE